jgi:WD40 repeat protein
VITAQEDGTVAFWDVATGVQSSTCCTLEEERGIWGAFAAEVVPRHADRVVVQYLDNSVHVWDLARDPATDVHAFGDGVLGFALSPQGETIVTVSREETKAWAADWETNTFEVIASWPSRLASSLDFSPDGRWIAWGGLDGVVRILDVKTGEEITTEGDGPLRVANGAATAVAFSTDGAWVLAGQADGMVRIWDIATAQLLAELPVHAGPVSQIDTFRDGRIATAGEDGSGRVFSCRICGAIDQVIDLARVQAGIYDAKPE